MSVAHDDSEIEISLYPDEIMALLTVAHNKYGWASDEWEREAPAALRCAVAALNEAFDDYLAEYLEHN
jgi:hypothetical protein